MPLKHEHVEGDRSWHLTAHLGDRRWQVAAATLMHSGAAKLIDDTATGFSLHTCQKKRLKNFSVICETAKNEV